MAESNLIPAQADRRLLEESAKAYGMTDIEWTGDTLVGDVYDSDCGYEISIDWDPLRSDRQALLLAQKCCVCINFRKGEVVGVWGQCNFTPGDAAGLRKAITECAATAAASAKVVCKTVGELRAALAAFPSDMPVKVVDGDWGDRPVSVQPHDFDGTLCVGLWAEI